MALRGRTILVLEEEYLIALEISRILEEANVGTIEVVRNIEELAAKEPEFGRFDAAIVEIKTFGESVVPAARRIAEAGIPIVFGTAFEEYMDGVPGFPDAPVVLKPYAADQFVAAVLSAIARRSKPLHGELA